jgi:hypothetical protein
LKDIYLTLFKVKGQGEIQRRKKSGKKSTKWMGKKRRVT